MINNTIQAIQKLRTYKDSKFPILTIYIGFEGKKTPNIQRILSEFHSLIHAGLSTFQRDQFKKQIERAEEQLRNDVDTHGVRSIAIFASRDLFEVLEFEFPLPSVCKVSNSAYLAPVIDQAQGYNRYLVLLVDRKKARIFTVHLGEIEEYEDFIVDIVPQEVKVEEEHYYGRSNKISRHIDDHLNRHLKIVAEKVKEFMEGKRINFIIIGGHEEIFEKLKKRLPKYIREKIEGEFVIELNVPINNVYLASKKVAEHIEQDRDYEKMEMALSGA